jgi:outer membrane protein assembly factor BamB
MLQAARDRAQAEAESIVYENHLAAEELAINWPSFRGPGGIGLAPGAKPPTAWNGNTGEGIIWKAAVPKPGNNSPIVWDDRVFLSGADESRQEVYCFDGLAGKILWARAVENISGSPPEPPAVSRDTGYAPSTMATDGSRVFAIFPTGDIVCFDFDGNQIWGRNLGLPENHYGHASSLITYRDRLIVQYDQDDESRIMALKSDTGETMWEKKRRVPASWASPIVVYTGRRPEIILNANPIVASYNAETGRKMWHVECMNGEVGPSVAYEDGIVYAVCQHWMLAAIDVSTHQIIWEFYDDLPDAASPVAAEGLLFLPTVYGAFSCLDGKTGEVYWMCEFSEGSYASPISADGKIYWTDQTGVTHILKAEREFALIADAELGQKCMTTAAFVGTRIYIRGETHLFCIGDAAR